MSSVAVLFSKLTEFKFIIFFKNLNLTTGDFSFAMVLTLSTAESSLCRFISTTFLLSVGITLL